MSGREQRLIHVRHLPGGKRVTIRPVCRQDAEVIQAYVRGLSSASRYNRFLGPVSELPSNELDRVTHLDGASEMALIVETRKHGRRSVIGEARYATAPDSLSCECALSVADAWRGKGLGRLLLHEIECRSKGLGVRYLIADILRSNESMKELALKLGFAMTRVPDDARLVRMVKDLSRPASALSCEELTEVGLPIAA